MKATKEHPCDAIGLLVFGVVFYFFEWYPVFFSWDYFWKSPSLFNIVSWEKWKVLARVARVA